MDLRLYPLNSSGFIDNSIVYFILVILGIIVLTGSGFPDWAFVPGCVVVGMLLIAGVYSVLFGWKGMGGNLSSPENKTEEKGPDNG